MLLTAGPPREELMYRPIPLINTMLACQVLVFLLWGGFGCSPAVNLPSVHEPLDSREWVTCASDLAEREAVGMIDDLTLDAKTLLCKGVSLAASGQVEAGLELLIESSVRDKADHRPHYLSGRILVDAARYEEALTAFGRSMKRFPTIEVPTERIGRTVLDKEGPEKACQFLAMAKTRELCPYGCLGLLAKLYQKTKQPEKSEAIYIEMKQQNPGEPAAYVGLAALRNSAAQHSAEAVLLEQARTSKHFAHLSESQRADILYSLAFARYNTGEYLLASKIIAQAIDYTPDRADWCLLAGWIEMKRDSPDEAYSWFEKATKLDDRLAPAHAGKGDAQAALGETDNAVRFYAEAHELDPTNTIFSLKLAHATAQSGDLDKARQLLDEATRMDKAHLPPDLVGKVTDLLKETDTKKE